MTGNAVQYRWKRWWVSLGTRIDISNKDIGGEGVQRKVRERGFGAKMRRRCVGRLGDKEEESEETKRRNGRGKQSMKGM